MFQALYHTVIYEPLYNALVFLIDIVPNADVGIAVILLTVIVKAILTPLSFKASRTQIKMREIEGPLREIREKHKDNREAQATATMALYREKGVNPFASIGLLFIQLPIIFGLYFVFAKGGLPEIDLTALYSFIPKPESVSMLFLGLVDMAGKSLFLAGITGATQFLQAKLSMPEAPKPYDPEKPTFGEDFARSMHLQMRYILPVIVAAVSYFASAAVALYWVTSNVTAIVQEWYVRRRLSREAPAPEA